MWQQQGQYDEHVIDMNQIDEQAINAYIAKVFGWMFIGLLVTTVTTIALIYGINVSDAFAELIYTMFNLVLIVFIAQVILVGAISARVTKMNPSTAKMLYIVYAITNGFTVGLIAVLIAAQIGGIYTLGVTFGVTTVSFGIMAAYGLKTNQDLTRFSSLLRMALIGLIIAIVANIFLGSSMFDLLIIIGGLVLFLGLVAADTNKIKNHFAYTAIYGSGEDSEVLDQEALASNLAIVGALMLYLDFINIFMFILRLLARRR